MDLRASLAMGDVNRVAESYHWLGMSTREGERTIDRLQALTGKPVVDSHYFDAQIQMASLDDAGMNPKRPGRMHRPSAARRACCSWSWATMGRDRPIDFDVHIDMRAATSSRSDARRR